MAAVRTKTKSKNVWRYDGVNGTTYQAIFKHKGHREVATHGTLKAANDWLAQKHVEAKRFDSDDTFVPITIKEIIKKFLQETAEFNNADTKEVAFNRFQEYFDPNGQLHRITWGQLVDFRRKMQNQRELKNSSVNRLFHIYHDMFARAKSWGHLRSNPFDKATKGPRGDKWLSEKGHKPRYLTQEEAQRTLDELETVPYVRRMVAFALQTGFDRKDLLELRWGDHVKEDQKVIEKKRAKIKSRNDLQNPNAGMVRISYAGNHQIKRVLAEAKANQPAGTEFVFTREDGNQSSPATISQILDRAQLRAGIEDSRKRGAKCLRHTFASWQVSICKTDIFVLKDLMGHSDISTTQIYAHLIDSTRANEAVSAIGNVMSVKPRAERQTSKVVALRRSNQ